MLLWKSQYIGRLHYNLYRAKQPDTTHISLNVGIIMVYKFSWLQSLPSPFPRGRKLIRSNCPWTLSLRGNVDSTLRAVNFQIVTPGWASPCLFLTPHPNHCPTPRDLVHTTVPGACTFGIGAFSFWQPCFQPFFCFGVLFLL